MFTVYAKDIAVGHSELESGDATMGVAFGAFRPVHEYSIIRYECLNNHLDQSALQLSVRTDTGLVIPCAGVSVLNYTAELDAEVIELNIVGIPYPAYASLFPGHAFPYE